MQANAFARCWAPLKRRLERRQAADKSGLQASAHKRLFFKSLAACLRPSGGQREIRRDKLQQEPGHRSKHKQHPFVLELHRGHVFSKWGPSADGPFFQGPSEGTTLQMGKRISRTARKWFLKFEVTTFSSRRLTETHSCHALLPLP